MGKRAYVGYIVINDKRVDLLIMAESVVEAVESVQTKYGTGHEMALKNEDEAREWR